MQAQKSLWEVLARLTSTEAPRFVWRLRLGACFEENPWALFNRTERLGNFVPCTAGCACEHLVLPALDRSFSGETSFVAACQCEDPACPDLELSREELEVWSLDIEKVARRLAQALDLRRTAPRFCLPHTVQVGSWSSDLVPVFLCTAPDADSFRATASELVARLNAPFAMMSPTEVHWDAACQDILSRVKASFVPLDRWVVPGPGGSLVAKVAPGVIFSCFQPSTRDEMDGQSLLKLLDLTEKMDSSRPPTLMTVFRLYCKEGLSASAVARRCKCAKSTVLLRLRTLHERTGASPEELRRISPQMGALEKQLQDSRARRIHRVSALDSGETGENDW